MSDGEEFRAAVGEREYAREGVVLLQLDEDDKARMIRGDGGRAQAFGGVRNVR